LTGFWLTEIIEAKQIALETKTSTEKYKQNIELKLESHNTNYNSNIKQLNTKCDNLLSLANNNLNKSNNNLLEFAESKHRLDEHLNNLSKPRKFKLYGSIDKLLLNKNFMGTMDQDYIYMCTTNIHLIKLNDQFIFKTIDQNFNVPFISKPKKIADIDTNLDYTKMKFLNYDIIDESDSYITEQALYIIPRNWSQMKDINEIIINNYIDTNNNYFISNTLPNDTYFEACDFIYLCGPNINITNTDIYESEIGQNITEIIYSYSNITNIQVEPSDLFYVEKSDNKYLLKTKIKLNQFNLNQFNLNQLNLNQLNLNQFNLNQLNLNQLNLNQPQSNPNKIKIKLFVTDNNEITFPRVFILNMQESIRSPNDLYQTDNKIIKPLISTYFNLIKSRPILFSDFLNLIQIIIPSNCQIINILTKIKSTIDDGSIYISTSDINFKTQLLDLSDKITNLIKTHKSCSDINSYKIFSKSINEIITLSKQLSPTHIKNTIVDYATEFINDFDNLIILLSTYLDLNETKHSIMSEQYNLNQLFYLIKQIMPILTKLKEVQIHLTAELNMFGGF
jgi:virulence-associated protein VapD